MDIKNIDKVKSIIEEIDNYKKFLHVLTQNYDSKLHISVTSQHNDNTKRPIEVTIPYMAMGKGSLVPMIETKIALLKEELKEL